MNVLKELVRAVSLNKTKSLAVVMGSDKRSSKLNRLYRAIADGTVGTDEEAMELLYPGKNSRTAYNKLKYVLKNRLLNTAFVIDSVDDGESDKRRAAIRECQRSISLYYLMLHLGAVEVTEKVALRGLDLAERYGLTTERLTITNLLIDFYTTQHGKEQREALVKNHDALSRLDRRENIAYGCWARAMALLPTKRNVPRILDCLNGGLAELASGSAVSSPKEKLLLQTLRTMQAVISEDYARATALADPALKSLPASYATLPAVTLSLTLQAGTAFQESGRTERAHEVMSLLRRQTPDDQPASLALDGLTVSIHLHSGRFAAARELYDRYRERMSIDSPARRLPECFVIFGAYLRILTVAGMLEGRESVGTFKMTRFLNRLPRSSGEKCGYNIAIRIARFAILLQQRKLDKTDALYDGFEKYRRRYLGDHPRSNAFIKLLLRLIKNDYRLDESISSMRLPSRDGTPSWQRFRQEIIPYETLWLAISRAVSRS